MNWGAICRYTLSEGASQGSLTAQTLMYKTELGVLSAALAANEYKLHVLGWNLLIDFADLKFILSNEYQHIN